MLQWRYRVHDSEDFNRFYTIKDLDRHNAHLGMCLVYNEIKFLSGLSPIISRYLLKTVMTVINNDDGNLDKLFKAAAF